MWDRSVSLFFAIQKLHIWIFWQNQLGRPIPIFCAITSALWSCYSRDFSVKSNCKQQQKLFPYKHISVPMLSHHCRVNDHYSLQNTNWSKLCLSSTFSKAWSLTTISDWLQLVEGNSKVHVKVLLQRYEVMHGAPPLQIKLSGKCVQLKRRPELCL